MAVINITVIESSEQILAGIPRYLILETNIPSTIFYTLDGGTPGLSSQIYLDGILLPTLNTVVVKYYATNGTDTSPVISQTFNSTVSEDMRRPRAATTAEDETVGQSLYPFGTADPQPSAQYLSTGKAGETTFDPTLPSISNGYDGDENPNNFTNKETWDLPIKYSTSNKQGETGPNIGTLPAQSFIIYNPDPPEETIINSKLFDPRALVIFQDVANEDPEVPPMINRQFFSLGDPEHARSGAAFYQTALESPGQSGSFVHSHFNPRDGSTTYYYRDGLSNKWIISKVPYNPASANALPSLVNTFVPRLRAERFVYQWRYNARRGLI